MTGVCDYNSLMKELWITKKEKGGTKNGYS